MPAGFGLNMARAAHELTRDKDSYPDYVTFLTRFDNVLGLYYDYSFEKRPMAAVPSGTYSPSVSTTTKIKGTGSVNMSTSNTYPATQYAAVSIQCNTSVKTSNPQILDVSRDFTVEGWIYWNGSLPTVDCYFFTSDTPNNWTYSASMNGFRVGKRANHELSFYFDNGTDFGGPSPTGSGVKFAAANTWYHWAVCKSGTTMRTYIDGVAYTSSVGTGSRTHNQAFSYARIGTDVQGQGASWYIDDVRITAGVARYGSGNFTPDRFSQWPTPTDPNWKSVVTLLKFDNSLADASNANVSFSGSSGLTYSTYGSYRGAILTSSSNRYVTAASTNAYNFGTGDFSIEMWVNVASTGGGVEQNIIDFRTTTGTTSPNILINASDVLLYRTGTTTRITGSSFTATGWYHIGLYRVSGTTRLYRDGVLMGVAYTDANDYAASPVTIGARHSDKTLPLDGYVSDVRITKGVGRYSAAFTYPSAPYPIG